jgi:hypothetical protein
METSFGFIADGSATSSDQNGDSLWNCTILHQDDLVIASSERDFLNASSLSKLLSSDFLESWDDSGSSGNCEEFDFYSTNPSDGR